MTEDCSKTVVAYLIAAGLALVAVVVAVVLVQWPEPMLEFIGVFACVYLFHLLAQAVRDSLP